jgi:Tfp pilus assembly protein PilF
MASKHELSGESTVEPTPPPATRGDYAGGQDLPSMLRKAISEHQSGNLGQAAMGYWAILDQDPDHMDALHLGGLVAHETGDSHTAIKMISRAIELAPQTAIFHNNLGNVYFDNGDLAAASESFRRAIDARPDFPLFHHNLGNCLLEMQQPAEAESVYRRALELQPDFERAACSLGLALLAQKKFTAAEPWFRQVLQTAPDDEQARRGLEDAMRGQQPQAVQPTAPPAARAAVPQYGQAPAARPLAPAAAGDPALAELRRQIAERLLRHEDPQAIASSLVNGGVATDVVRREVEAALSHPYIQAGLGVATKLKKRDWVLNSYRTLDNLLPPVVERRYRPTRDEFLRDYYSVNRPVVIQGMMDNWPAMEKWTPDHLREHYGHLTVEIQANRNADRHYETNMQKLKRDVLFGDYIDMITDASTNDVYMTANNTSRNRETLKALWNDIDGLPEYLDPSSPENGFLWIGPAGTITPLHHDLTNNFMAQVRGRKLVKLIPSFNLPYVYNHLHCYSELDLTNIDYSRFPMLRNARIMDVILEPGDVLFLPVGCWHYVKGLDMSITMSFTNFRFNNDFHSFYDTYHAI